MTKTRFSIIISLTYAAGGQQPLRLFGRLAVRVHGLQHVQAKRECDDGLRTRAHDHALHPQPHERHERAKRLHDVRVVGPRLGYHAAQLGVTVCAHLETTDTCRNDGQLSSVIGDNAPWGQMYTAVDMGMRRQGGGIGREVAER